MWYKFVSFILHSYGNYEVCRYIRVVFHKKNIENF